MGLRITKERYDHIQFWEMFNPTTNNFSFWLVTASICFFVYSSLSSSSKETSMILIKIMPYVFLGFGYICLAVLAFLLILWIFGFKIEITKRGKKMIIEKP